MSSKLHLNIEAPEPPGPVINGECMTHLGSSMDVLGRRRRRRFYALRMLGYFTNTLSKINRYIENENKAGKDIPRFTKSQIRLIVKRLERQESFKFEHAIDCLGPPKCHCDDVRTREFSYLVKNVNHKLPPTILETLI